MRAGQNWEEKRDGKLQMGYKNQSINKKFRRKNEIITFTGK